MNTLFLSDTAYNIKTRYNLKLNYNTEFAAAVVWDFLF